MDYNPFYIFTLGRKKCGCIPAGIITTKGKKEYSTTQLLESIFAYWHGHHKLPPTLIKMKEPRDWFKTQGSRFDKQNFIKLCIETTSTSTPALTIKV